MVLLPRHCHCARVARKVGRPPCPSPHLGGKKVWQVLLPRLQQHSQVAAVDDLQAQSACAAHQAPAGRDRDAARAARMSDVRLAVNGSARAKAAASLGGAHQE